MKKIIITLVSIALFVNTAYFTASETFIFNVEKVSLDLLPDDEPSDDIILDNASEDKPL